MTGGPGIVECSWGAVRVCPPVAVEEKRSAQVAGPFLTS